VDWKPRKYGFMGYGVKCRTLVTWHSESEAHFLSPQNPRKTGRFRRGIRSKKSASECDSGLCYQIISAQLGFGEK